MVNALALEALRPAKAQSVDATEMKKVAVAYAVAEGATRWEREALATLFGTADAIPPPPEVRYINGQHRAQAMLEAGVRRTAILRGVEPEPAEQSPPSVPPREQQNLHGGQPPAAPVQGAQHGCWLLPSAGAQRQTNR